MCQYLCNICRNCPVFGWPSMTPCPGLSSLSGAGKGNGVGSAWNYCLVENVIPTAFWNFIIPKKAREVEEHVSTVYLYMHGCKLVIDDSNFQEFCSLISWLDKWIEFRKICFLSHFAYFVFGVTQLPVAAKDTVASIWKRKASAASACRSECHLFMVQLPTFGRLIVKWTKISFL